ncbi:MAG: SAM-dependent chlorinase/fluorinase [Bacteroidales bacterium]|nr:SAM-dependent chlorinase/fluorinase [Bacteroidales bacterium]
MAIITLTSDWGTTDYYVAAVKGAILSRMPNATIVDITHNIDSFNVVHAGFILRNCYRDFPEGTIHIIGVNTIESEKHPHVVVKAEGQYFISTDNGIFSLILDGKFEEAYYIDVVQDTSFFTFIGRDRFAKVAVMIAQGVPLSSIGAPRLQLNKSLFVSPGIKDNAIDGTVVYVDTYENLVTNISKELFESVRRGRKFDIQIRGNLYSIDTISETYLDVPEGQLVAIFGAHGFLELALNNSNLSSLCGMERNSMIKVVFYDDTRATGKEKNAATQVLSADKNAMPEPSNGLLF